MKSTVIFGSIGALAETSELERQAYNLAFAANGLDWHWTRDAFREVARRTNALDCIKAMADEQGDIVNPAVIHQSKTSYLSRLIEDDGITARPGVQEVIRDARQNGLKVAWATTTEIQTIESVLSGLYPDLVRSQFDWIGEASMVPHAKPAPDIYHKALEALDVSAEEVIAIEDSPEAASAALAAGIEVIACPNALSIGRSFPPSVQMLTDLTDGLALTKIRVA